MVYINRIAVSGGGGLPQMALLVCSEFSEKFSIIFAKKAMRRKKIRFK